MAAARLSYGLKAFHLRKATAVRREEGGGKEIHSAAGIASGSLRILPAAHLYNMQLTL